MKTSINFTTDEKKILESEATGKKFCQMDQAELLTAGNMVCFRISKISGCMLPCNKDLLLELFKTVSTFITNNKRFRLLTCAEIVLAASWNAAGEFVEKVKHWQNELNLDYVGELLNQYCRHKQRFNLKEKLEMESMKFLPQNIQYDPFFWEKEIELRYQQFLTNNYNMGIWLPGMYTKLADLNFLPYSYFVQFLQVAYRKVIDELNVEYAELKSQGKALHKIQEKYNYVFEYKHSNHYVMAYSKRFAVRAYFQYCQSLEMKNLFKEEK